MIYYNKTVTRIDLLIQQLVRLKKVIKYSRNYSYMQILLIIYQNTGIHYNVIIPIQIRLEKRDSFQFEIKNRILLSNLNRNE